jgi:hypothetical protein
VSTIDLTPGTRGAASGGTNADRTSMSRISQMMVVWAAPACIIFFIIGCTWLGGYLPPRISPGDSAVVIAQYYQQHALKIRVGLVFTMIAYALMCVWGVAMATQTRRKEGMFPALTYLQLTCMAAGTAQIVVNVGLWATAAFRAGEIAPEITQALNDAGFIILLGTWFPFTMWAIALGLNILLDKSGHPVYPRWSGYLSIWAGVGFSPGGTVWFFKSGPFGWTGIVCMYVPFAVFGFWLLYFAYQTAKNVKRGFVHEQELAAAS